MKNVLVLAHDDEGQEARLQAALDATRALGGHLTCIDVVSPPLVLTDPYAGAAMAVTIDYARQVEEENRARLRRRLAIEDVAWTMRETIGDPAHEIEEASALADLIVVSSRPKDRDLSDAGPLAGKLALCTGRPILAVPPECRRFDTSGNVLVAWDGSNEASEVLHQAMPLLQLANSAELLLVELSNEVRAAEDAAAYLFRHGIAASINERPTTGTVAEAVLERAREMGAAYIVMGAFGHGRLAESIFGGVTRSMLLESDIPLLLAH